MTFSEKLKTIREDKGYTQQELAEALHLSATALSHYETGSREPSIETIKQIAEFLDVSIDYLYSSLPSALYISMYLFTRYSNENTSLLCF